MAEQKGINAHSNQRIVTVEDNLNKKLDRLKNDFEQKIDSLQYSILRLINQLHVHLEEENLEEECLTDTILGEQAQLQFQEELKEELVEAPKEL